MEEQDLYAALGVSRDTSADEIRRAYRKLARVHHPDVNPNDPQAEERFKQISFAWDVLSDPEKRKLYDEFGMAGLTQGFDSEQARGYQRWSRGARRSPFSQSFAHGASIDDLMRDLFGAEEWPGRGAGHRRGADVDGEVSVDFLDAVRGGEVRVAVQKPAEPGGPPNTTSLRVRIPAGADEGTRIRLAGQGAPGQGGGPAGDLYLTLRVRSHRWFRREDRDLLLDLPVTLSELIVGGQVDVPTPDGRVTMTIPPRSQNAQRLRLRGKGVAGRDGSEPGDMIVRLVARLPDSDDPRLEELARELEGLYGEGSVREDLEGGK